MSDETLIETIDRLRKTIKDVARMVNEAKEFINKCEATKNENRGEVMANITLSYRHLEDASMRLGKVLQHFNGGVSIYDNNVVGDPRPTTPIN